VNLQYSPPDGFPPAKLEIGGPVQQVNMGQQLNVALGQACTAIYTQNLTDCSAFCVLYRPGGRAWSRAALIHMKGGPDPNAVDWQGMVSNMPNTQGAVYFAILANSQATVLTEGFLEAVQTNLGQLIPNQNRWVYNNKVMAINFGVDYSAFAGQ
jgi:hypothetical protein